MLTRFIGYLVLLTAIGLTVRLACLHVAMPIKPIGDEVYYANVAFNMATEQSHFFDGWTRASWPPGNAFAMSLFLNPEVSKNQAIDWDGILRSMLMTQAIIGALLVPLAMLLSRKLLGDRPAVYAGFIVAFYPTFIAYSHYLWAGNLFTVLVTAALTAAVYAHRTSGLGMVVVTGMLFGLATLTRETSLVIALACAIWWVWVSSGSVRRRAVLRGGLMLFVAIATVAPWTVRNYRVLNEFVPVSTVGWMAVAEGNIFGPVDWLHPNNQLLEDFRGNHGRIRDEVERMNYARRTALELIQKEQPTWILKKFVRTSGQMFGPDSSLFKKISRGTYPSIPGAAIRFLLVATIFAYIAVAVLGVLGITIVRGRSRRLLPCLVIGSVFLLHLIANASSRYRLPLMPLLIAYSSYALLHLGELRSRLTRKRWIALAVILLWFFGLCVPYFAGDAISLWDGATYISP